MLQQTDVVQASERFWPDLEYVRKCVSVREVARELGLHVRGNSAHCWRTEAHQHGDRSASLYFTRKNKCRCAVCDGRTMSNLDLIEGVLGCDLRRAVEWVTARWNVPEVPRGRHVKRREPQARRFRVGTSGSALEQVILSGFWGALSKAAQSVLVTVHAFTDSETGWAVLSFRALRRYAGLSFGSVDSGLRELRRIGLLESERTGPAFHSANRYRLNFESPGFLELRAAFHQKHVAEVRSERKRQTQLRKTQGKPLSTT